MTHPSLWQIAIIPWRVLAAYWAIMWLCVKPTKTAEPVLGRISTILPLIVAFELLFSNSLRIGVLGWRFLPPDPATARCCGGFNPVHRSLA